MRRIIDLDMPERFATGTVGEREERTFFLQAVQGGHVTTVQLEKEQVSVLADRVLAIIDEVERRGLAAIDAGPAGVPDERPLEQPLQEEFRVGTMVIAWDEDVDQGHRRGALDDLRRRRRETWPCATTRSSTRTTSPTTPPSVLMCCACT